MHDLVSVFASHAVLRVLWAFLTVGMVKGGLLVLAAWLLCRLFCAEQPSGERRVWLVTLAGLVVLPIAWLALPPIQAAPLLERAASAVGAPRPALHLRPPAPRGGPDRRDRGVAAGSVPSRLLATLVTALLWCFPPARAACRFLGRAIEIACGRLVLQRGVPAHICASDMLELPRGGARPFPRHAAPSARAARGRPRGDRTVRLPASR